MGGFWEIDRLPPCHGYVQAELIGATHQQYPKQKSLLIYSQSYLFHLILLNFSYFSFKCIFYKYLFMIFGLILGCWNVSHSLTCYKLFAVRDFTVRETFEERNPSERRRFTVQYVDRLEQSSGATRLQLATCCSAVQQAVDGSLKM